MTPFGRQRPLSEITFAVPRCPRAGCHRERRFWPTVSRRHGLRPPSDLHCRISEDLKGPPVPGDAIIPVDDQPPRRTASPMAGVAVRAPSRHSPRYYGPDVLQTGAGHPHWRSRAAHRTAVANPSRPNTRSIRALRSTQTLGREKHYHERLARLL